MLEEVVIVGGVGAGAGVDAGVGGGVGVGAGVGGGVGVGAGVGGGVGLGGVLQGQNRRKLSHDELHVVLILLPVL